MNIDEEKRSVREGAFIATGGTDAARRADFYTAETEVIAGGSRKRKKYTDSYKRKVVDHVSELRQTGSGEIGGYLRREGIYYTMVNKWEKKFQMSDNKKIKSTGSKGSSSKGSSSKMSSSRERDLEEKVKQLEKELERTKKKLQKSEMIIDFQKKISFLLNPDQEEQEREDQK